METKNMTLRGTEDYRGKFPQIAQYEIHFTNAGNSFRKRRDTVKIN